MNDHLTKVARTCLDGAEDNTMTFPEIVGTLMQAGFESYVVDFRRSTATYLLPNGECVVLPIQHGGSPTAATLDATGVQSAIKEAQQLVPGYTYAGFCGKVMAAGCVGYMVSSTGRRAVYFGRDAEIHVERFPQ